MKQLPRISATLIAAALVSPLVSAPAPGAESKIIAAGATLEKLAGDFAFTEGPASDAQGNVFFTDQPNDRILKWSVAGKLSTFMHPCGRANGLSFDSKGNLWACADEKNELWRIGPAGEVTVVVKDYQGKLLNGPNDVWPVGGLYFWTLITSLWKRAKEQDNVYYLPPADKGWSVLTISSSPMASSAHPMANFFMSPTSAQAKLTNTASSPTALSRTRNSSAKWARTG
jgi:gluconolactonase